MTPTTFILNGNPTALDGADPTESLLRWLRRARLTGTKEGCADGDCGACTVALLEPDGHGAGAYRAINSCLLPMGLLPGREVLTVEALADGDALHPVQAALVECAGSQCGYCTPGFVMSLFAGYHGGELGDHTTEGNLCRCTGYRPIRAATEALAANPGAADGFSRRAAAPRDALSGATLAQFHSPVSVADALALKARHPDAVWIAGATDLGVDLSHWRPVASAFIALDRIAALQRLDIDADRVCIGAGVPLSRLEHTLGDVLPAFGQMLPWFAARQVRNRATLGGNLGSASPIGDLLPLLLAHEAVVHFVGPDGARDIAAADFFLDYRKTARADNELIVAVTIPRPRGTSASYKVAKRQTDDISIVAAAFVVACDDAGRVDTARLAYGGVAAIPKRATRAESLLAGAVLDDATVDRVASALDAEFAPLDDHRASAGYRRQLCGNLFRRFVAEHFA
ncbi:xanthine dehydrogenase small subunit [Chiayiivirga flava]|uniref:Xanthine dehydrogenase small subunit n=1 Tax=Chiayiivirga flava TaxID=659595 RepID=A0A7W8D633_9GAMM|nr:FAD binding domain-containing protein [Chiayiivirga flava]MBB5207465.1 xanthine dehydrogenase small subunit [Chiayiivirga flava]